MQEQKKALRLVEVLRKNLEARYAEARELSSLMSTSIPVSKALGLWKTEAVQKIHEHFSPIEAQNLAELDAYNFQYVGISNMSENQFKRYIDFLDDLSDAIETDPASVLTAITPDFANEENEVLSASSKENLVFLVHGHDEPNLYKLKDLLKEEFNLSTIIMKSQAGSGRTMIEKFESEALRAAFAFVLLTPDDIIRKSNGEYSQARPNVIFELGWFYGKLGRDRVCILFKKGTQIYSDLDGVSRVEFIETIDEKYQEIKLELIAGGLLSA